jgi:hypothetical protein
MVRAGRMRRWWLRRDIPSGGWRRVIWRSAGWLLLRPPGTWSYIIRNPRAGIAEYRRYKGWRSRSWRKWQRSLPEGEQ